MQSRLILLYSRLGSFPSVASVSSTCSRRCLSNYFPARQMSRWSRCSLRHDTCATKRERELVQSVWCLFLQKTVLAFSSLTHSLSHTHTPLSQYGACFYKRLFLLSAHSLTLSLSHTHTPLKVCVLHCARVLRLVQHRNPWRWMVLR